jgi:hypothetical protein
MWKLQILHRLSAIFRVLQENTALAVKMETYYSEMSVDFQRTTRRYIPEDRTLRNHSCVPPRRPGFDPRSGHVGFVVDKVAL